MKRLLILFLLIAIAYTSIAQPDPRDTKEHWKITKEIAAEMIKCKEECTDGNYDKSKINIHRSNVYLKILKEYPPENVIWVPARYRPVDESRYRQKRGYSNSSRNGKVTGHNTWILQATSLDKTTTDYFDLVTIKPPPHD